MSLPLFWPYEWLRRGLHRFSDWSIYAIVCADLVAVDVLGPLMDWIDEWAWTVCMLHPHQERLPHPIHGWFRPKRNMPTAEDRWSPNPS